MIDFNELIPEMRDWNNGAGIDVKSWIGCEGSFRMAVRCHVGLKAAPIREHAQAEVSQSVHPTKPTQPYENLSPQALHDARDPSSLSDLENATLYDSI